MKRKYNLEEKLQKLPLNQYKAFMRYAHEVLDISPNTMGNWRKLTIKDKADIPTEALLKLCKLFSCTVEDMKNYEVTTKPIGEYTAPKDELKNRFGLQ